MIRSAGALVLLVVAAEVRGAPVVDRETEAPFQASLRWLELIDGGDTDGAWASAGRESRACLPVAGLVQILGERQALGAPSARVLERIHWQQGVPGFPRLRGLRSVALRYKVAFVSGPQRTETVFLTQDATGIWRVQVYCFANRTRERSAARINVPPNKRMQLTKRIQVGPLRGPSSPSALCS